MRKLVVWLLVITMIAGSLTACGRNEEPEKTEPTGTETTASVPQETEEIPTDTVPQETEPTPTEPSVPDDTEVLIGHEDTYWVAEAYSSDDGEGAGGLRPMEPELWTMDLLIRVDGTACLRDIHEGICLMDDSYLNLTWECTPEGEFLFYSLLYAEHVFRGICENGILSLDYWGTTLKMKQEQIPQAVGQRYTPAELAGTWLMVSGETEGWQWEAMPGMLSSIVFRVTAYDGPLVLSADMEERDYYGDMLYASYGQVTEVLHQPLYEGCENEVWSVRIGEASVPDENGYPTQTEYYATLLRDNTLILQQYFTIDGYPAVSHQTYMRFTDLVSWMSPESMNLDYTNWFCTGYEDASGEELSLPPELDGFSVVLSPDQTCCVNYGDGSSQEGTWSLDNGGVLFLRGADTLEEPFWFGGAISGYWIEATDGLLETYQMVLYYNGGILKLTIGSYG